MQVCWRLWNSVAHIHIIYPYLARASLFMLWHQGWDSGFFQLEGHICNFPKHFWKLKNKAKTNKQVSLPVGFGGVEQQVVPFGVVQCHPLCSSRIFCGIRISLRLLWAALNPGALHAHFSWSAVVKGMIAAFKAWMWNSLNCLTLSAELEWLFCRGLSWGDGEKDGIDLSCPARSGLLFLLNMDFLMLLKCLDALIIKVPGFL